MNRFERERLPSWPDYAQLHGMALRGFCDENESTLMSSQTGGAA